MSNELVANVSNETIAALDKAAADGALAQREVSQFKRTMMTAATPSKTPKTETHVMTEVTERFGFRYLNAKKSGKGIAFRS